MTIRKYDAVLSWFSANWPADLDWPADIERPEPVSDASAASMASSMITERTEA